MLEAIGDKANVLSNELGFVLATKLNLLLNGESTEDPSEPSINPTTEFSQDYYLEFDGFSFEDMANIEEYLVVFSGYLSHRPTQQRHTRTTWLYRSTAGTAMLSRNMHKLMEELNMRATINFNGNAFSLKRITLRDEKLSRDIAEGW
jgi:hypothetical protein